MNLLIYAPSYERIKDDLHSIVPDLAPIIMMSDGRLVQDGAEISVDQIAPDVAWPNTEVYLEGPVRDFMIALLKSPNLKWVQTSSAGVEHPVFAAIVKNGAKLTNSDAGSIGIAEFVMSSVLNVFHPFERRRESQATKVWDRVGFREISGTNWVIIGFGNIGAEIGKRANAFGANVIGVRRSKVTSDFATVVKPNDMMDYLPSADVVVVAAALTPDTHHVINANTLSMMSKNSVLVNIGRGGHVDEAALIDSLNKGIPGTAILDVFDEEPLPSDSPLWTHPRVRLTAHTAASSDGVRHRNDHVFLENLKRYVKGEPLLHAVDKSMLATDTENINL